VNRETTPNRNAPGVGKPLSTQPYAAVRPRSATAGRDVVSRCVLFVRWWPGSMMTHARGRVHRAGRPRRPAMEPNNVSIGASQFSQSFTCVFSRGVNRAVEILPHRRVRGFGSRGGSGVGGGFARRRRRRLHCGVRVDDEHLVRHQALLRRRVVQREHRDQRHGPLPQRVRASVVAARQRQQLQQPLHALRSRRPHRGLYRIGKSPIKRHLRTIRPQSRIKNIR
jgi:hypothetical protein